jgi:hypothetical protein
MVMDWLHYPLDDPSSQARKSLYLVRSMHARARRAARHVFDEEKGEENDSQVSK